MKDRTTQEENDDGETRAKAAMSGIRDDDCSRRYEERAISLRYDRNGCRVVNKSLEMSRTPVHYK